MQDGTFITRVFVILIIVMLVYAGVEHINHKQNLERMILDQQDVIEQQNIALQRMRQANLIMHQYISQQQSNVLH